MSYFLNIYLIFSFIPICIKWGPNIFFEGTLLNNIWLFGCIESYIDWQKWLYISGFIITRKLVQLKRRWQEPPVWWRRLFENVLTELDSLSEQSTAEPLRHKETRYVTHTFLFSSNHTLKVPEASWSPCDVEAHLASVFPHTHAQMMRRDVDLQPQAWSDLLLQSHSFKINWSYKSIIHMTDVCGCAHMTEALIGVKCRVCIEAEMSFSCSACSKIHILIQQMSRL